MKYKLIFGPRKRNTPQRHNAPREHLLKNKKSIANGLYRRGTYDGGPLGDVNVSLLSRTTQSFETYVLFRGRDRNSSMFYFPKVCTRIDPASK